MDQVRHVLRTAMLAGAVVLAAPVPSALTGGDARADAVKRATRAAQEAPADVVVDMTAARFSFSPAEIRMKAGHRLSIRLRSEDTDHGFRIRDTSIDVIVPKRGQGTATVTFTPERQGKYVFECSHLCGTGHAFMRGAILVTD